MNCSGDGGPAGGVATAAAVRDFTGAGCTRAKLDWMMATVLRVLIGQRFGHGGVLVRSCFCGASYRFAESVLAEIKDASTKAQDDADQKAAYLLIQSRDWAR